MAQTDRLYQLKNWLDSGRCLGRDFLLAKLEVSYSTLKRDLELLRNRLNAPVVFDPVQRGWRLDTSSQPVGTQYELPGLWRSAEEIHALLTMQHLLANLDAGGLLVPHIEPLVKRLNQLLVKGALKPDELARRIRVRTVGARNVHLPHFQIVGSALLQRRRLVIHYHGRGRDQTQEREVSPQPLIHYRDNWYLDAWCHLRQGLRSFSVDAIRNVHALARPAIDVADTELDEVLVSGYGIFAGKEVQWARLRFTPERAKWVTAEIWHPKQRGAFDAEGRWLLEVPYADPRELVMDILRHVPEVEVLGPVELIQEVRLRLVNGVSGMAALTG